MFNRCMVLYRLVYKPDPEFTGLPQAFYDIASETIKKRAKAQGYGLHSQDEGSVSILSANKTFKISYILFI